MYPESWDSPSWKVTFLGSWSTVPWRHKKDYLEKYISWNSPSNKILFLCSRKFSRYAFDPLKRQEIKNRNVSNIPCLCSKLLILQNIFYKDLALLKSQICFCLCIQEILALFKTSMPHNFLKYTLLILLGLYILEISFEFAFDLNFLGILFS